MPQIELVNVEKRFGSGSGSTLALSSINLAIERGSFVSLCGPSGCGKSTLLSMVLGLQDTPRARYASAASASQRRA